MIGLSLSFCVHDMITGFCAPKDVEYIEASTAARTDSDWDRVIKNYRNIYWSANPDEGERITRLFLAQDKIRQPRLEGKEPREITRGWWKR